MLETRTAGDVAELERTGEAVEEGAHRLAERWEDARVRVRARAREAAQASRRAARATDGWVHAHPWPAVGIATALGVLLGVLSARRAG